MSEARSIGAIVAPIFAEAIAKAAELHGVQVLLGALDTDEQRRFCIKRWRASKYIDDEQARLLFESLLLDAA